MLKIHRIIFSMKNSYHPRSYKYDISFFVLQSSESRGFHSSRVIFYFPRIEERSRFIIQWYAEVIGFFDFKFILLMKFRNRFTKLHPNQSYPRVFLVTPKFANNLSVDILNIWFFTSEICSNSRPVF